MGKASLPYVYQDRDRHNNIRTYFRKRGQPKIRLPDPTSRDFHAAYQSALNGGDAPPAAVDPSSLAWLINRYIQSPHFQNLALSTRRWRERELRSIPKPERPYKTLPGRAIRRWRDDRSDRPGAANQLIYALRALFAWAIDEDLATENPARHVKPIKYETKSHPSWTPAERQAFEAYWPPGSRERRAYSLMLYTTCRVSDAIRLGRQHVRDGEIQIEQKKTKYEVWVPIHPALHQEMELMPDGEMQFLLTAYGKSFNRNAFSDWFTLKTREAGIATKTAHGLRTTMIEIMSELGLSDNDLISVSGHKNTDSVKTYKQRANRRVNARRAMAKIVDVTHHEASVGHKAEINKEKQ